MNNPLESAVEGIEAIGRMNSELRDVGLLQSWLGAIMLKLASTIKLLKKERKQSQSTLARLDNALNVLTKLAHGKMAGNNSGGSGSTGRTLSVQARERIAAAQRKRWAKWKKSKSIEAQA